ncbi:MAG: hypothetical protein ACK4TC_18020 [Sphingomonas pseudosanguinis]|uniref:hypothetical protein n=1 Tax=Sphingomonas pseudosanguinis TaxID=413712 RepID=UPI003919F297
MAHRPGIDASREKRELNADKYAMELWKHIEPLTDEFGPNEVYRITQALGEKGLKSRRGGPVSYHTVFRTIERMKPILRDEFISFEPNWTDEQWAEFEAMAPEAPPEIEWVPVSSLLSVGDPVRTTWGNGGRVQYVFGDGFAYLVELGDGRVLRKSPKNLLVAKGAAS